MRQATVSVLAGVSVLCAASAHAQSAKDLVGRYQMDGGDETMELRADGSISMSGDEERWSVKGNVLTIGSDSVSFQLQGDKLVLSMSGVPLSWTRLGAAGRGPSPLQKAAARAARKQEEVSDEQIEAEAMAAAQAWFARNQPQAAPESEPRLRAQASSHVQARPAGTNSPVDQQLQQLLASSAWCSFSYNGTLGASRTTRAVFRPDGVLSFGGGGEVYSSGAGGTHASQGQHGGLMRWQVANGRLYVDDGSGAGLRDVNLQVTLNSSGHPILKAEGREYMRCQ